jgi:SAM-dependent methyltransferase
VKRGTDSGPDAAPLADAVIWQDVECGGYDGDLELWDELAAEAGGLILELGCGTGRVALRLAAAGHSMVALDNRRELIAELRRRAAERGVELDAIEADAREFDLDRGFRLILAPMQLVQLLGGPAGRGEMLRRAAEHLEPGGRLAVTLLGPRASPEGSSSPLPDVRELGGAIYSSLPIEVQEVPGGLEVRRLRQRIAPDGELGEELDVIRLDAVGPDELEAEARAAGLRLADRREIPPTPDHVGSAVLLLEVG